MAQPDVLDHGRVSARGRIGPVFPRLGGLVGRPAEPSAANVGKLYIRRGLVGRSGKEVFRIKGPCPWHALCLVTLNWFCVALVRVGASRKGVLKMSRLKIFAGTVLALGVSLGMAAPASATIITTAWQTQTVNYGALDGLSNLTFNGFSAVGTLISVNVELIINSETLNNTYNNTTGNPTEIGNPFPVNATGTTTIVGTGAFASAGLTATNVLATPTYTGNVAAGTGTVPGGTASVTSYTVGPNSITTDLAPFIGGVNIVTLQLTNRGNVNGSSELTTIGYSGSANITAEISYTYDNSVVPEPATLSLLGVGLIGLIGVRRKAKKTAG